MVLKAFRRPMLRQVLTVVVSGLLTLALFEIGLRLFAPQYHNYVQPDDVTGYSFVPGAHYTFIAPEKCPGWYSSGRINSHGLRDREYGYTKSPGTFRILALGDSYTEGLQFDIEKTWPKLLELQLNGRRGGLKYEVINAGRSAMGTGTEYLEYLNRGRNYAPDLVLVLFIPNDFKDNSRTLNTRLQPYFFLSEGKLKLDNTFIENPSYRVRKLVHPFKQLSYVVTMMSQFYNQMEARQPSARTPASGSGALTSNEQEAVAVTLELFRQLAHVTTQDKAKLVIVIGTNNFDVNWTSNQSNGRERNSMEFQADQIITDFAMQEEIPFLSLKPLLRAYSNKNQALVHGCMENYGGGHWSEIGHIAAATEMYEFLVGQAIVP
jgi:hypothetical protein